MSLVETRTTGTTRDAVHAFIAAWTHDPDAVRGTFASPDGLGGPVELDGCEVCELQDGKIVARRGYFDRARIMEQPRAAAPSLR